MRSENGRVKCSCEFHCHHHNQHHHQHTNVDDYDDDDDDDFYVLIVSLSSSSNHQPSCRKLRCVGMLMMRKVRTMDMAFEAFEDDNDLDVFIECDQKT